MSRRLFLEVLLSLLLLLGLSTLEGGLVALMIPLLLYLAAALFDAPVQTRLHARRTLRRKEGERARSTQQIAENQAVVVDLEVTNAGEALSRVWIEDRLPAGLELVEGASRLLTPLAAGETVKVTYTVRGRRGAFDFSPVDVTAHDSLGILRRFWRLEAGASLWILPHVERIKAPSLRPRHTHGFAGSIPSGQPGSGVDFYGVRKYHFGDARRHINWRLTARHADTLFTNEFEQERITDVGLILDARQQVNVRYEEASLFEHSVHATASLADAFLRAGHRVALLIYGRALERTFPSYGKVQRARILHALAHARPGDSLVFEHFDYLPTRFFPARSQLVIISPLIPADLPVLARLRARGYHLLVVSPDPVTFEARWGAGEDAAAALAARICRMERTLLLRRLRQYDIRVVDWAVESSLEQALYTSLAAARGRPARVFPRMTA
ncbi:MAG: DUF58 domain-containing protein [Anaerolineae bacterium]